MSSKAWLSSLACTLGVSLFALLHACRAADSESVADQPARTPNILFVFSDDHATHAIGAYGGSLAELNPTPNIDRLAAQGMRFENSFCTNSICGPSRAVILTGKHSHKNGFKHNGDRFDGDQQTFPKLLQTAGYRTAMIGKWHLGSDPQGFDHWDVLPGQGDYYNPVLVSAEGRRQVEGYCTDIVTELAIDWMESIADSDQPFLLMCQHKAPHRNWMPALRHLGLYGDIQIPEPATLFDRYEDNASPARIQEMEIDRHMHLTYDLFAEGAEGAEGWPTEEVVATDRSGHRNLEKMTPTQRAAWDAGYAEENARLLAERPVGADLVRWKYQRYLKNYLRAIRGVDDSVGRLVAYLETAGIADETVVIYSSDQGFYLGDHGWYDKRWMYEESLKMPLIVRWPGVTEPGAIDRHLVQNLDYAQTFLELAGAEQPEDMQGHSLVNLLRGREVAWRDSIYYHYYAFPSVHQVARHNGVRTERFKLMRFYEFDEWELYDLARDPDELHNVYGQPEYANDVVALQAELEALRTRYEDPTDVTPRPVEWRESHRAR